MRPISPKFQVYKDAAGKTRFRIRANNNRIVAVGEAYEKYASCLKGMESVKRNCWAPTEDLTVEGGPRLPNPKYQIFKDASDKFRFHLKAANGEIIAKSEGYESMDGCLNGIEVLRDCAKAEIEDPFAVKKQLSEIPTKTKMIEVPKPQALATIQREPLPEIKAKPEISIPPVDVPKVELPKAPDLPKIDVPKVDMPIPREPVIKTEDVTISTPSLAEAEMIQEIGQVDTTLELYSLQQGINKGEKVAFQGRLFKSKTGKGIPEAKIRIYERDKSVLGDDYLAFGKTGQDGSFSIPWKARNLTWRKTTGNIYAKFSGNEKAKPSQSSIQQIAIK